MNLTKLTFEDEKTFRSFVGRFRPTSDRFEDSWAYILQATRKWPKKYLNGENLVLLSKKEDGTCVIPHYFCSDEVLVGLVRDLGQKAILKNVSPKDVERLKHLGFEEYGEGERWSHGCLYDNQTFPQQILNLDKLLSLRGKEYSRLRGELNGSRRKVKTIERRSYNPARDKDAVRDIILSQEERNPGTLDSHEMYLELERSSFLVPSVFTVGGKIIGYTLVDHISDTCAAFNALVYDTNISQLSSRLTFESARMLVDMGYRLFNLQGSETAGVDRWKRKFNPINSNYRKHLIFK